MPCKVGTARLGKSAKGMRESGRLSAELDALERMDTGFALTSGEHRKHEEHRGMYDSFLKTSRQQRQAAAKFRHLGQDLEDIAFGPDLGLEPFSGLPPPFPAPPKTPEPLFQHTPETAGDADSPRVRKLAVFDANKLVQRKFKAQPETELC